MRRFSWQIAGFLLNLALGIAYVKGWANNVLNSVVFLLLVATLSPVGYWLYTHEKLAPHRDILRTNFAARPVKTSFIALILIVPCLISTALGLRWFYAKKLSAWIAPKPEVVSSRSTTASKSSQSALESQAPATPTKQTIGIPHIHKGTNSNGGNQPDASTGSTINMDEGTIEGGLFLGSL